MEKEIIWTEKALHDRFEIYSYWAYHNQSETFSEKLDQKIVNSAHLIAKYPSIGKPTGFQGVRVKVLRHVSIFYLEENSAIILLRVWDNRQNPEKITLL